MEDSDVYAVAVSLSNATHVELLYGNLLLKEEIGCHTLIIQKGGHN